MSFSTAEFTTLDYTFFSSILPTHTVIVRGWMSGPLKYYSKVTLYEKDRLLTKIKALSNRPTTGHFKKSRCGFFTSGSDRDNSIQQNRVWTGSLYDSKSFSKQIPFYFVEICQLLPNRKEQWVHEEGYPFTFCMFPF